MSPRQVILIERDPADNSFAALLKLLEPFFSGHREDMGFAEKDVAGVLGDLLPMIGLDPIRGETLRGAWLRVRPILQERACPPNGH